ncbi:S8 family serine peptidase, partial [Myxococcota bacterium]|nr:S8 family serine peptidase [Myxococcota bacterium]
MASLGSASCSCDGDVPEALAALELDATSPVTAGAPFTLVVTAVGTDGAKPLTSFDGTVTLSASAGTISPASIVLERGRGEASVTLGGALGAVTIEARTGAIAGLLVVQVVGASRLPGADSDLAAGAIPTLRFHARPEDYSDDHPSAPGLFVSFDTIAVVLALDATVGDANALLAEHGAEIVGGLTGIDGEQPGILFLRLPTVDHAALEAALASMRARPIVTTAVHDALLEALREPRANDGTPEHWTWASSPGGDNWGLESVRAPAAWNLLSGARKVDSQLRTGIVDVGFVATHEDLAYDENLYPENEDGHGTHVAGIIGAGFDDGVGVDGIDPLARLVVTAPGFSIGTDDALALRTSWGEEMMLFLVDLAYERPDVRVVNFSVGYNWSHLGIDASTHAFAQYITREQGNLLALGTLLWMLSGHPVPALIAAAGNDSDAGLGLQSATWSSPYTYAGLELGLPNITVVESVKIAIGEPGDATRSAFSNVGGHVSAPGEDVVSTYFLPGDPTRRYRELSGTSMAAPHVTGLISYLYHLAPELTHGELRSLLTTNAVAVGGGASPKIDAFATVMDLDRIEGGDRVLRMLVDTDDGTVDGNLRVHPQTGEPFYLEDVDGDGGEGDGRVDMRDFRRFRDAFLETSGEQVALDGAADHPKRDLDRNGRHDAREWESDLSRFDFNGDGRIHRLDRAWVGGAISAEVTDLEVLAAAFADPSYDVGELFRLMFGGDVYVWPQRCLALSGVARVRSTLTPRGALDPTPIERVHTYAGTAGHVITVPPNPQGWDVVISAEDAGGGELARAELHVDVRPGEDLFWDDDCAATPSGAFGETFVSPSDGFEDTFGIERTFDG